MKIDQHRELFICDCGDPHHQFIVQYFTWNSEGEEPELYFSVHLSQSLSFWKRLGAAFRYVFSRSRSRFGDFDETILNVEDAKRLRDVIDKWLHNEAREFVKDQ